MDGKLFPTPPFHDFGPIALCQDGICPPLTQVAGKRTSELRKQLQTLCPRKAGVYGMLDSQGELIYVGKAKSLRVRLLGYFRKSRDRKAGRIIRETRRIVWEACPGEFSALLRELELIRRWRPRWNVQGQPLRRLQTFCCVGRAPAPYVFLSRRPPRSHTSIYGPLPMARRTREAAQVLNDLFGLRDCPQQVPMIFPEQGELFPGEHPAGCLRMEIGTCLGPCTGTCTKSAYQKQVQAVRRFLTGADASVLERLKRDMSAAAVEQQFERAGRLRDMLVSLTWLHQRLERLRKAQAELSMVYPQPGPRGEVLWYAIHGARVVACVPAKDGSTRGRLEACYRQPSPHVLDSYEHVDGMMLVMAWFRKYPAERAKCLSPADAIRSLRR